MLFSKCLQTGQLMHDHWQHQTPTTLWRRCGSRLGWNNAGWVDGNLPLRTFLAALVCHGQIHRVDLGDIERRETMRDDLSGSNQGGPISKIPLESVG